MSKETNNEDGLVRGENQMTPAESDDLELAGSKVLTITEENVNADVKGMLASLVQYANIGHVVAKIEKGAEYIVQIPLKYKKAFDAGELLMNESTKTGITWPTLYKELKNGKRKIVDNLPVKKELRMKGNPFESIAQGYQNLYLQQQITELTQLVTKTLRVVERIEKGQMDDRIGLMNGAKDEILLALDMSPEDRKQAINNARSKIHTAQGQIFEALKTRVAEFKAIPESAWKRFWIEVMHEGTFQGWDEDFRAIQSYYSLYLQATQLLADSYAFFGYTQHAERVYEKAEENMGLISFDAMKTLRNIHKKNNDMLYYHPVEYVTADKEACLEAAKDYDFLALKVSGAKLLEALNNGE